MTYHMFKAIWGNRSSIEIIVKDFIQKVPKPESEDDASLIWFDHRDRGPEIFEHMMVKYRGNRLNADLI